MKLAKRQFINYSILIPYLILSIIGLIVVYSTTSVLSIQVGKSPFRSVLNQGLFWVISLVLTGLIYRMNLNFLKNRKLIRIIMIIEILLLLYSRFFTGIINGAHGWIMVGGFFSVQPAEYLKVIVVWFLAEEFARKQDQIELYDYQVITKNKWITLSLKDWRSWWLMMVGIVVSMPDLGNATIVALTTLVMISVSGIAHRWFGTLLTAIGLGSGAVLATIWVLGVDTVAKIPVFGYVAKRFRAYYNPFADLSDSGHQLAHSLYAITNGGWFGLGLGNSIEKKGYLPESQTDFAFAIVMEEFGFIGAGLILALLFFLILRIILVGIRAKDPFNSMMAIGIGGMLLTQTFVNIGGISGLIPMTGVTFPFLSQGGNSLLILSVSIAFVLNIDASEKRDALLRELEVESQ